MLIDYLRGCLGVILFPIIFIIRLLHIQFNKHEEELKETNEKEDIKMSWFIHEEGV